MRVYGRLFTALVCRVKKFQINSYFVDVHDAMGAKSWRGRWQAVGMPAA